MNDNQATQQCVRWLCHVPVILYSSGEPVYREDILRGNTFDGSCSVFTFNGHCVYIEAMTQLFIDNYVR